MQLAATVAGSGRLYAVQDRMTIVRGRRADPVRADEVVATPVAVALHSACTWGRGYGSR